MKKIVFLLLFFNISTVFCQENKTNVTKLNSFPIEADVYIGFDGLGSNYFIKNNVFTKQVLDNINYAWNLAVVDVNKDNKQDIVMIALTYGGFTVFTNNTIKSATTNLAEWSDFSIESNIVNENLLLNINIDRSRWMISNNAGNIVLSGIIGKYDEGINVAHLPGGNYFITAFNDKGKSKTIRFIKT